VSYDYGSIIYKGGLQCTAAASANGFLYSRREYDINAQSLSLPKPQSPVGKKAAASSASKRKPRPAPKPGPGRPTAARVEAINGAILARANEEFLKTGYQDTQMEAVAKAAGVSKQTLYDRYPNKYALLKAVVADRVAAWSDDLERDEGETSPDLRTRLKQRAHGIMSFCCSGEFERVQRFLAGSPSMDELRRMTYEVGHQRMALAIAKEILERTTNPPIAREPALRLAEMLMGMLHGWWLAHLGVRTITRKEALAYADHAVDVLLDGRTSWAGARPSGS
jgi:TetR/AcrR family transcriptional repressor of mexJK operon